MVPTVWGFLLLHAHPAACRWIPTSHCVGKSWFCARVCSGKRVISRWTLHQKPVTLFWNVIWHEGSGFGLLTPNKHKQEGAVYCNGSTLSEPATGIKPTPKQCWTTLESDLDEQVCILFILLLLLAVLRTRFKLDQLLWQRLFYQANMEELVEPGIMWLFSSASENWNHRKRIKACFVWPLFRSFAGHTANLVSSFIQFKNCRWR